MSVNFDLMEKDELQRLYVELFKQFEDFKKSSINHLQRLKDFEIEKDVFIEKIKSLEDDLMNSKLPLGKSFNSDLSIDKVASVSHAISVHRTMFIEPSMSHNHTHFTCGDKRVSHKVILSLLVITVALVVTSALIASRFVLKNLGIDRMYLGKVNLVSRTKSRI
jgi:hypothetical protein